MNARVLIVDDDQALAENLAELAQTLGAETTVAPDGRSALARADETQFDVAIIDVRLPDADGVSLLQPLRERSPFTQLVLVTGNATLEGAMAAVRGGAFAYVPKPFSPPDFIETVRRACEQAGLHRERERLQEMSRRTLRAERLAAVGTMAAGLAHEVRNPLNSASLQLALLERRLGRGEGADTTLPIARIIKSEIQRLDRLVSDFLAFAQPRPLERMPVDLTALLSDVVTLIQPEAEATGITVTQDLEERLPSVSGDAERLRQVLLNLTRNAREAMQERGGVLTLRARPTPGGVEVDVEDDGPGFRDELPVFDAFFTTKPQGTGLGLSLVHRIVSDHDGTIRVRSRPGCTCFTFSLPRA